MRIVCIRERDSETFEINERQYGSFVLDSSAEIPGGANLDVTGFEFSGTDGGYNTSARTQRRPFDLPFTIREDHTTEAGLFELIREASGFFLIKDEFLNPYLYTLEVYTNDRVGSSYQMRHGAITVPVKARTQVGECKADALVSFIFADPNLYPIGESGLTFRLYAGGQSSGTPEGRSWSATNGAAWTTANGKTWLNAGGSGDPVAVDVISISPVPVSIQSNGTLVSPQIINLTNGSSFTYNGTLGALDVLTVDTSNNVLVNGLPAPFPYSGSLTAIGGTNTFALIAAGGSPGYVDLTILGAF